MIKLSFNGIGFGNLFEPKEKNFNQNKTDNRFFLRHFLNGFSIREQLFMESKKPPS